MCRENENALRTKKNYEKDSGIIKQSDTGIKEPCIFHEVKGFHITENITVDVMHDVLEGICKCVLRLIINHYVFAARVFYPPRFK